MLTLADTLVKERRLQKELNANGDAIWEQSDIPKEKLCRYFSRIQDELYDLQFDGMISPTYWKMVEEFKDLFVTFFYDEDNQRMFLVSTDGEAYVIGRGCLTAMPWTGAIPANAISVDRRYVERVEDNWTDEYNRQHEAELYP